MKKIFKNLMVMILQWESKMVLRKYRPKIVAITGSVGKTSTKDAVAAVLEGTFSVRKSKKSFNSELGVPLSILDLENAWSNPFLWFKNIFKGFALIVFPHTYPEWLVLEVGAGAPGDIASVASWLRPDIALITRFGKVPAHVGMFSSPEEVYREKAHLVEALRPEGFLIVNADDSVSLSMMKYTKAEIRTYGFSKEATFGASNVAVLYEGEGSNKRAHGVTFRINVSGGSVPVHLHGTAGRQHVYSALAGLSVAACTGIDLASAGERLMSWELPTGRMSLLRGVKNTTIIDDSYNSSPAAAEAALETLREIETFGRKIAVMGDMLELGEYAEEEHKRIGELAGDVADLVFSVGEYAPQIAEGALFSLKDEQLVFQFEDSQKAGDFLQNILQPGDIILVKGSQGIRMERTVEEIMLEPERKRELLVRQDEEWMKR